MKLTRLQYPILESKEAIKDNSGRIIGYFEQHSKETIVYSAENRYIGKANQSGTFNAANVKLSPNNVPALLFALVQ